ncbi:hypothetical protein J6590_078305 [Homalodisca vitripennis]|nr:hypothetical protein J6590_078305 [Homalodisca vitripennis]
MPPLGFLQSESRIVGRSLQSMFHINLKRFTMWLLLKQSLQPRMSNCPHNGLYRSRASAMELRYFPVMWLLVRKSPVNGIVLLSSTMWLLLKQSPARVLLSSAMCYRSGAFNVRYLSHDVAATEAEPSASGIVLIVLSNVAGTEAERSVNGIESDGGSRANCLNRRDVWLRHQRQLTTIEPFRYTQKPFIVETLLPWNHPGFVSLVTGILQDDLSPQKLRVKYATVDLTYGKLIFHKAQSRAGPSSADC